VPQSSETGNKGDALVRWGSRLRFSSLELNTVSKAHLSTRLQRHTVTPLLHPDRDHGRVHHRQALYNYDKAKSAPGSVYAEPPVACRPEPSSQLGSVTSFCSAWAPMNSCMSGLPGSRVYRPENFESSLISVYCLEAHQDSLLIAVYSLHPFALAPWLTNRSRWLPASLCHLLHALPGLARALFDF
jgi:hypothetical protein